MFPTFLFYVSIRPEKRAQRLSFWVRRPPGGVGVFHAKGWWPKSSCPPSKLCLPWVSKRGIRDVPGILPGCPGPLGVFKSLCEKVRTHFSFPIQDCFSTDFKKARSHETARIFWSNWCWKELFLTNYNSVMTKIFTIMNYRVATVRFGSVAVRARDGSSGSGFRFRRFLSGEGFLFQYCLTKRDGSGSSFGFWKNRSDGSGFRFWFGSWAIL